jgi:protein-disulfide isomerase
MLDGSGSTSTGDTSTASNTDAATSWAATSQPEGFTGRYRSGPEDAPVRVVIFSDYQCSDCRGLEMQAKVLLGTRSDVSLSAKQFPLDVRCNPAMSTTMHENACKAAKIAEAAGLLRGNDGFWQMHHWLFERGGQFTDADLQRKLQEWGYDAAEFDRAMNSAEVAQRIRHDTLEAESLGIFFTPMVFINGVELRGYRTERALIRAVELIAASNPAPGSPLTDRPPAAASKYVDDWRHNPRQIMPQPFHVFPLGASAADAPVRIDVFADLQDANSAELDAKVRAHAEKLPNVVYVFHPFPFDQACNSVVSRTVNPLGCRAARAAETAGILGGDEAYWKMQQWLLANRESFTDQSLRAAATAQGLDADRYFETLESTPVSAAIGREVAAAKALNVNQLPSVYINGRFLPRWKHSETDIIGKVIETVTAQTNPQ